MPPRPEIDPGKIAYYEKAGWEAYYDRNWPRAFWLLVQLNRVEFHMSWPQALSAALDTVRASIAFAPLERSDVPKATAYIEKFYAKAGRSLGQKADAATLARLEMDYWVVHRRLAIARKQDPERRQPGTDDRLIGEPARRAIRLDSGAHAGVRGAAGKGRRSGGSDHEQAVHRRARRLAARGSVFEAGVRGGAEGCGLRLS